MKMLVALDQSPYAVTVLEKAIALAKLEGATLSIMTVAEDFMDLGDYLDVNSITDKVFATTKAAAQDYGKVAKDAGVDAEVIVEQGVSPADLIIAHAKNKGIDMIIMGHQGRKGLSHYLIGSVATKVVRHAPCSVLIVR
ncbi:universal stress protein [Solidesulfovibrio carbinolicus]|uniref:Universal stress protein n=1 Tax=Solidesulfovibrio carbinolicus TaxID=296842 RepID=A0A4P6HG37_9BACT|nr:universal stress protein [Solidesulfovibrio carbinolicus]QAZ66081.1 universal stress protein [Solidesulfovibrio carbinolicus]